METTTKPKYKVDINKISEKAIESAFGVSRYKVNEDGLSPKALEAKKNVVAVRTAATLFVREALAFLTTTNDRITPEMRREVEQIAIDAQSSPDCIEYLAQFCEEA